MVSRAQAAHNLLAWQRQAPPPALDYAVTSLKERNMINQPANTNTQSQKPPQKLSDAIKKTWGKLTDEEIGFQATKPEKFFEAVKTKYSISKEEAEKTVKKLETECAAACSTDAGKGADKAPVAPVAKTA